MDFFKQVDLDKIQAYAGQEVESSKFDELKEIYEKLSFFCSLLENEGFKYTIRRDPRKQAGPGTFVFQEYQWAQVYPREVFEACYKKICYVVGLSDSLHFHIMGIKEYQDTPPSLNASKNSWTEVDVDDSSYEQVVKEFVEFERKYRELFLMTGSVLGIQECENLFKTKSMMKHIDLLNYKKQIILQGAPGTGKTYAAKNIAEMMIFKEISGDKEIQKNRLEGTDQFQLIQFHPAYSYEDFVRGISAKPSGNQVIYQSENRIIADFAKKAQRNLLDSKKDVHILSKEKWSRDLFEKFRESVIDEIDDNGNFPLNKTASITSVDEDAFRYSGEIWKNEFRMKNEDIILLFSNNVKERQDIKLQSYISGLARTHATYFKLMLNRFYLFTKDEVYTPSSLTPEPLKSFVLIIDEINRANLPAVLGELIYALEYRGHPVESIYEIEGEGKTIKLPHNLFIIGTMNTADRSIGHIDYAIRRRFAFIDVLPTPEPIKDFAKPIFKLVSSLFINNYDSITDWQQPILEHSLHLASDFRPEDVWVGHSYFISDDEEMFKLKLKYEILPILKEYIKDGVLLESARPILDELSQNC